VDSFNLVANKLRFPEYQGYKGNPGYKQYPGFSGFSGFSEYPGTPERFNDVRSQVNDRVGNNLSFGGLSLDAGTVLDGLKRAAGQYTAIQAANAAAVHQAAVVSTAGSSAPAEVALRGSTANNAAMATTSPALSVASGATAGYGAAELFHNTVGRNLTSGDQGLRTAGGIGAGVVAGSGVLGGVGGFIGAGISNIMNPGAGDPEIDRRMRAQGQTWQNIFSQLSAEDQRWITSSPDMGNTEDLKERTRVVADFRNRIEESYTGQKLYSDEELKELLEEIDKGALLARDPEAENDMFSIMPPMRLSDGWLYDPNIKYPGALGRGYTYESYLEALKL
jgi:hypothetical protein